MEKLIAPGSVADKQQMGAVTATGLRKWYHRKGQPPVHVLENCSFDIEPGKLTVLMGTSGCGKSTLAYALAGYVQVDAGVLSIDGQPIKGAGPDRTMVFQETALWPWMTVLENVLFGPRVASTMKLHEAKEEAQKLS